MTIECFTTADSIELFSASVRWLSKLLSRLPLLLCSRAAIRTQQGAVSGRAIESWPLGLYCRNAQGDLRTLSQFKLHRKLGDVQVRGCGTMRIYGFGAFQPCGYCFLASSSLTEPAMITSSPCFQFTGVATLCLAVS